MVKKKDKKFYKLKKLNLMKPQLIIKDYYKMNKENW